MSDALPCPFCGAGETCVDEVLHWTGKRYIAIGAKVQHWCPRQHGKIQNHILIAGVDKEDAIATWNRRASPATAPCSERYVEWTDAGGVKVDVGAYLKSPEGKAALERFARNEPRSEPTAEQLDAALWRLAAKFLDDGHIPGAGFGTRIKLIKTCPQFGDESEMDFRSFREAIEQRARELAQGDSHSVPKQHAKEERNA